MRLDPWGLLTKSLGRCCLRWTARRCRQRNHSPGCRRPTGRLPGKRRKKTRGICQRTPAGTTHVAWLLDGTYIFRGVYKRYKHCGWFILKRCFLYKTSAFRFYLSLKGRTAWSVCFSTPGPWSQTVGMKQKAHEKAKWHEKWVVYRTTIHQTQKSLPITWPVCGWESKFP